MILGSTLTFPRLQRFPRKKIMFTMFAISRPADDLAATCLWTSPALEKTAMAFATLMCSDPASWRQENMFTKNEFGLVANNSYFVLAVLFMVN